MITVSLFEEILRKESPKEILSEIMEGSSYHRIQGSWEIVNAMKWLKEKLAEKGIENEILYFDTKYSKKLGIPVPRWELNYAEVELDFGHEKEVLSTEDNILLAAPHTPSGEVEGEVKVAVGHKEIDERSSGKIILVTREQRLSYYLAKMVNALGVIFSKETVHDYVFPYFGLFFEESFLKNAPPAVSIPWAITRKVLREIAMGGKVKARIYVECKRNGPKGIPVLKAWIGDGKEIVGSAHICHPAPGAHDNMSGCVALYHSILKLKELYNSGDFKGKFVALWVPEYSGTISYIWEERPRIVGNVNLDMVGTTSKDPIKVNRGFLVNTSVLEASFIKALGILSNLAGTKLSEMGYKVLGYANGSDHDLFNYYSLPGFMVSHIIDEMYHTSGDLPNNIDPYLIREIGVATVISAVLSTSDVSEKLYKEYLNAVIGHLKLSSKSLEVLKREFIVAPERGTEEREADLDSKIPGLEIPVTSGRLLIEDKVNLAARFYSERELERASMYGGSMLKRGFSYHEAKEILCFDASISEGFFRRFFEMITDEGALD